MSAPQIEDRSDLVLADRGLQLVFPELGGSVKRTFLYGVEIALVLDCAPVSAAGAGG